MDVINIVFDYKAPIGIRPLDVVVLLKLALSNEPVSSKSLASDLFLSYADISGSLNRSMMAKLISPDKKKVFKTAFYGFIEHGLKHVFPAEPGPMVGGLPTAHSAPVLKDFFISDIYYVWPSTDGKVWGRMIVPLYPNQVFAALKDERLYAVLALIDAIRVGRVREQQKALELLRFFLEDSHR